MRRVHQIAGTAFFLVAAFLGYHAIELRYYTPLGPGPGFLPVWLCALLALLAIATVLQATKAPVEPLPAGFFAERRGYARISTVLVSLLTLPWIMALPGFR